MSGGIIQGKQVDTKTAELEVVEGGFAIGVGVSTHECVGVSDNISIHLDFLCAQKLQEGGT